MFSDIIAERIYRALARTTCKPGVHAPYDCVMQRNGRVYATNMYVMHIVEGLDQPGCNFFQRHADEMPLCRDYLRFERFFYGCEPQTVSKSFLVDPQKFALALAPHRALSAPIRVSRSDDERAPLIFTSKDNGVRVFTAVQPLAG